MWQLILYHYSADQTYQYMEVWDRTKKGWRKHTVRNGEETVSECRCEDVLNAIGDVLRGKSEGGIELKIDGELVFVRR